MMDKDLQNINNDTNEEGKSIQNENEDNNNLLNNTEEEVKEDEKENIIEEVKVEDKEFMTEEVKEEEKEIISEEVKEEEKESITEEVKEEEKESITVGVLEEEEKNTIEVAKDEEDKETVEIKEEVTESITEEVKEEIKEKIIEEVKEEVVDVKEEVKEESVSGPEEEGAIDLERDEDKSGRLKWYAVRIISGHENKVKTYLDSQIKQEQLEDKIRNVLIPMEKVFEVKSGKKKVKKKNFLPGYILVEADLDDKIRSFISQSPSIINMVGSKSVKGQRLAPIPLRGDEIKRINAILNEDKQSEKIDFQLAVGDPVKVTSGPFNNFTGNVLDINIEKMKVKVMVSIFGRKTPIELEFTQIEKQK